MRAFLTFVVLAVAMLIALAVALRPTARQPARPIAASTQPAEGLTSSSPPAASVQPSSSPAATAPAGPAMSAAPVATIDGLHVQPFTEARVATIGSLNAKSGYKEQIDLSAWGASILRIQLTDFMKSVRGEAHYVVLEAPPIPGQSGRRLYPFAARTIEINGQLVSLCDQRWELIEPSAPGSYRTTMEGEPAGGAIFNRAVYALTIVDSAGKPVVELRRTYSIEPDSYHIRCDQQIINRTSGDIDVVWEQRAQGDALEDLGSYMGDRRQAATGYFLPEYDKLHTTVLSESTAWKSRNETLPLNTPTDPAVTPLWPNEKIPTAELVWIASLNRYFALVTHPGVEKYVKGASDIVPLAKTFPKVRMEVFGEPVKATVDPRVMAFVLRTEPMRLTAGQTRQIDVALFAGPRQRDLFAKPLNEALGLGRLVRYELGCAWCTFQWLARFLLEFLTWIYLIVRDWAVAIIILVLVVRLILHPITKKAQVNMMLMGKQMQSLQPEMEKIKKRYADDQQKINAETMKLYREKGVNPAGMLGCLPMFLQMPIWVALYAMLYYAIELRHQPAFYGFFQLFGDWQFLADLSAPDALIRFADHPVHPPVPLLNTLDFSTFNVLPIIWTVVMFVQQKYTTPPPANEQAAQQQKMMRWMMLLFPLFLYGAPSGLTLYMVASSVAGIADSYYVRKHVKEQEARGDTAKIRKPPKPGGFMDRLSKAMEEKQRQIMEQKKPPQNPRKP